MLIADIPGVWHLVDCVGTQKTQRFDPGKGINVARKDIPMGVQFRSYLAQPRRAANKLFLEIVQCLLRK